MKDVGQRTAEAAALKHAVPYIRIFKGRTFVIKAGGGALEREATLRALLEQVEVLHQVGIRVVLVHGGGTQSSGLSKALGAEARFVEGRRVTDEKALEVAAMVLNGSVSTRVLAACRGMGLPAVGVSGVDAGLVQARKRPPVRVGEEIVDYGYVGDVVSIDPRVLTGLMEAGYVPVVSPLSAADDGTVLNINADTVASALAVALKAEKLLFLTGAPGILERPDDPGSLVSYTDLAGLRSLRDEGGLVKGMLPKTSAIEAAIQGGVRRVHILSHDLPDGLLAEVFTNEGVGTLVVEDVKVLTPAEQAAGHPVTPALTGAV
ncbi:MAG TPA: acetylglutamate kinase [Thermoanaerobaculia bacterium]|jgi:acetylglutamate kinase|nr:acetylglutamate kinase [Thermoanaerobaculia bacterium]